MNACIIFDSICEIEISPMHKTNGSPFDPWHSPSASLWSSVSTTSISGIPVPSRPTCSRNTWRCEQMNWWRRWMFHVLLDSISSLPMRSLAWPCDGRDAKMTLDCLSYAARKILYPKARWVSQWNKYNSRALPTNYTIVPERRDETATRDQRKKMNIAMVKLINEAVNSK